MAIYSDLHIMIIFIKVTKTATGFNGIAYWFSHQTWLCCPNLLILRSIKIKYHSSWNKPTQTGTSQLGPISKLENGRFTFLLIQSDSIRFSKKSVNQILIRFNGLPDRRQYKWIDVLMRPSVYGRFQSDPLESITIRFRSDNHPFSTQSSKRGESAN